MSKKSRNHKNCCKQGNKGRGMNAYPKTAGMTVNINKLSLHMDERMTTSYDNHSFHPVDGSHYCGNDVTESNRCGCDHDHCGFHHTEPEDFIDNFRGAPCIDMDEMAETISERLKLDVSIVLGVLMAEDKYLEERGLAVPLYDDDEDDEDDGEEDGADGSDAVNAATDADREKEAENNGN